MSNELEFRFAERRDAAKVLYFIRELARHQDLLDKVVATEDVLHEWLFDKRKAEVLFAVANGEEVGFALFFYNFSTFLGRSGLYLEDLFVLPDHRGKGYGRQLLQRLAQLALERDCGRLDWLCLDWNKPSIGFYLSLGAEPMEDWTLYRLSGKGLRELAGK